MIAQYSFRLIDYSVASTPNSVFYFGGYVFADGQKDGAVNLAFEYKNDKFAPFPNLRNVRYAHRSIEWYNWFFIVGGSQTLVLFYLTDSFNKIMLRTMEYY